MFVISPLRRAVAAFFLLVFFAVVASAVCVAFGANAIPSLAPGAHQETSVLRTPEFALGAARRANAAGSQAEAALRGKPSAAALHVAGSASRAGVGT